MIVSTRTIRKLLIAFAVLSLPMCAQEKKPAPAHSPSTYRVAGTIVSKTDSRPLANARVTLRDVNDPKKFEGIITTEDGKFQFSDVPAGKYSLTGAKRGFISASYDQHDFFSTAIVTGAGLDTEHLTLKLAPDAVITGKVLDESGDPVRNAMVNLYYDDHSEGVDQIQHQRSAQTNDLGVYELTPLAPGTYFVSVSAKPWYALHPPVQSATSSEASDSSFDHSLDVAYPITYYADVTDADSATPIPVRGGDRLQVDLHVNPVPAIHIILRVPGDSEGRSFPRLQQPAFDNSIPVQVGEMRPDGNGAWELSGIPAGKYNVRIEGAGAGAQMNGVDLNRNGEQIDTSAAEPLSEVKVSLQIAGETPMPKGFSIGLRGKGRGLAGWGRVDEKGQADIQQVSPGQYQLMLWGASRPYSISRVSAQGAEVVGHTVNIAAGSAPVISVTAIGGSVDVSGVAKKNGKPSAGAMVVLVPSSPEGNNDLFRRDQSDLDGTFTLRNVIPGSYTLLAIENGWDLDWSRPEVIAAYLKRGHKVQVASNTRILHVAEAIEVQSK